MLLPGLRKLLANLADICFPPRCLSCRAGIAAGIPLYFCPGCRADISLLQGPLCHGCGAPFPVAAESHYCGNCLNGRNRFDMARSVAVYKGAVRACGACLEVRPVCRGGRCLWDAVQRGNPDAAISGFRVDHSGAAACAAPQAAGVQSIDDPCPPIFPGSSRQNKAASPCQACAYGPADLAQQTPAAEQYQRRLPGAAVRKS